MDDKINPHLLVVEDQLNWQRLYKVWLKEFCHINFCSKKQEVIDIIENNPIDVILMDLGLPEPAIGIHIIEEIFRINPQSKIIVVTAFNNDRKLQLHLQKLGVYAVFGKDERLESELPILIRKAYEMSSLEQENSYLRQQFQKTTGNYKILGESKVAKELRDKAKNISQTDTPVLLTGPTGSGKTYFAHLIHNFSERVNRPFLSLNCATLSPQLAESELFGHIRGAYTGADTTTEGKFRAANKGTILLDEIGELPKSIQAKLLQVIEEKSFFPLGGHQEVRVDVRVLASSNRDLTKEMKQKRFRQDLYYRLSCFVVHIPGLTERKEDIPVYFDHFLNQICETEDIPVPEIEPNVYDLIKEFSYPGNLRELKNLITRLLLFRPQVITVENFSRQNNLFDSQVLKDALHREYNIKELSALYAQELFKKYQSKGEVVRILGIDYKTLNRYLDLKVRGNEKT